MKLLFTPSVRHSLRITPILVSLLLGPGYLRSNPTGETVISGGVEMQQQGSSLIIQQSTDRAIIHWQDFSIGHGELTQFIQPSSTSAVLNRVVGDNLSAIHGSLLANGQVFLINPNGIIVGSTGVINTAGFTASTLDVGNAEFLQGGDLTFFATGSGPGGSIVNLGRINALEGDVMLIARQVENHGEIHAPNGTAVLAAGSEVLLKASGEERVFVQPSSTAEGGRVTNTGGMQAAAAELKAAGGNEYALAINNSGAVRATGVERRGGRVFLSAGRGTARSSGVIEARKAQGGGGDIKIEAERVELAAGSLTDASAEGDADGGQVRIGGGLRGKDATMRNAQSLEVETAATLKADGAGNGNGGTVILWSEGETHFAGSVLTRGGAGGFAEVSGAFLQFSGKVDTGGGTLLLDPVNLGVQAAAGDQDNTWGVGQINTLLADNNVILEADNNITWAGDATLTYTNSQNRELVLRAGNNIIFNNGASIIAGPGAASLAVVLNADRDASSGGNIQLTGTTINSNGGAITLGGGADPLNIAAIGTDTGGNNIHGLYLNNSKLTAAGGNISLRGTGAAAANAYGIYTLGPVVDDLVNRTEITTTGAGTISMTGLGSAGTESNNGIVLGSPTLVQVENGTLVMTGTGGISTLTNTNSNGIVTSFYSLIQSTGSGSITLTGTGRQGGGSTGIFHTGDILSTGSGNISLFGDVTTGGSGFNRPGIWLYAGGRVRSTGSGDINLTGTSAVTSGIQGGVVLSEGTIQSNLGTGDIFIQGTHSSKGISFDTTHYFATNSPVTINSGANNITFTTDRPVFNGNTTAPSNPSNVTVTGSGLLTLQPLTAGTTVGIAGGAGTFSLSVADLTKFQDGFSEIIIGKADAGVLTVNAVTFTDNLRLLTAGNMALNGTLNVGANRLALIIGGTTTQAAALTAGTLRLGGNGNFTLLDTGNDVDTLSKGGTGSLAFMDADSVAVGTVDGVNGLAGSSVEVRANTNITAANTSITTSGGAIILNSDRDASGAGNIQLTGTTITSNGGAITLGGGANPLTTAAIGSGIGGGTGSVTDIPLSAGIYLSGSTLTSDAGNISLRGQGIAGTTRAYGIHAEGGSVIGSNTGTGTITLHGTGGAGTTNGWGVNLVGADTAVRSLSGNISITGQGGAGTGNFQYGTLIWSGAQVVSAGSATVTLSGTAGNGASTNYGFYMDGADTAVTSAGGAISITGQGGGTGTDNRGIFMDTAAKVLGTGAASVTLNGTGGNGTSGNHGVYLNGDNTVVRSVDGNISITGQGAGSGAGNYGAYLNNQSEVAASGTGNITVHGTGGGAGSNSGNHGIGTYNHAITATSGFITLTGFGGAAGATNYGILLAGTNVTDSRIATNGAITLTGTGGGTGSGNRGVVIGGGGATVVQAGSGALNITGTGSAAGTSGGNDGIWIASGGLVSSSAGKITLDGTGRGTGAQSVGVVMGGGGKVTATNAAEIEITGQGSTSGTNYNFGFFMTDAGTAVTGQTGALSITGTGGGSGIENHGIRFAGTASPIATTTGAITLTGHSPSGTAAGILLYSGARVGGAGTLGPVLLASSDGIQLGDSTTAGHVETGAGAPGGTITLRADDFIILRQSSSITTQNQAIVLNSDRDASGAGSIRLVNATVQSNGGNITFGGGADPSSVAAIGFGTGSELIVDSGDRQFGILLHNSTVTSGAGAVLMRGAGFTSGNNNIGLRVQGGSLVSSTSGNVTLVGQGGTSGGAGNANVGFYLQDASITSTSGTISITGTAQTASGTFNFGLGMEGKDGTALISNATGGIILEGTGAGNDANAFGVLLSNRVSILSTGSASIQITATAGPGATVDLQSDNPANNTVIGGPDASGNITLTANTIEWGAGVSLQSSGTLLLQPRTPATTIGIGTGAAGTLALDAGILGSLADGFSEIIIGRADSSGAITANAHTFTDNLRLRTSGALAVNGALSVGASRLVLLIGGGTTQSAALTAGSLRLGSGGDFILENVSNSITTLSKDGGGSVSLRNNAGLTVGTVDGVAGVSGSSVDLRVVSLAGNLTLDQAVVATGAGDAAVLSTPEAFVNNAGAAAITAGAGRWVVYSASAAGNTFGGLLSGNLALLGESIATLPPAAVPVGNRYIFATSPVLDVRPTLTDTKPQDTLYLFPAPVLDTNYAITGFIDAAAFGGAFLQDTPAGIGLTGAPVFSSAGASVGAGAGVYPVTLAAGTLANTSGYTFAFPASTATLTVSGLSGAVSGTAAMTLLDYDNSHDRNDRLMKWISDLLPPLFLSDTDGLLQFAPQITPAGGVILHLSSEDVQGGE